VSGILQTILARSGGAGYDYVGLYYNGQSYNISMPAFTYGSPLGGQAGTSYIYANFYARAGNINDGNFLVNCQTYSLNKGATWNTFYAAVYSYQMLNTVSGEDGIITYNPTAKVAFTWIMPPNKYSGYDIVGTSFSSTGTIVQQTPANTGGSNYFTQAIYWPKYGYFYLIGGRNAGSFSAKVFLYNGSGVYQGGLDTPTTNGSQAAYIDHTSGNLRITTSGNNVYEYTSSDLSTYSNLGATNNNTNGSSQSTIQWSAYHGTYFKAVVANVTSSSVDIYSSSNGITWSTLASKSIVGSTCWKPNLFIYQGNGDIYLNVMFTDGKGGYGWVTYKSTNGGASFGTNIDNFASIVKNHQLP